MARVIAIGQPVNDSEREAIQQLLDRAAAVVAAETAITREQFRRNHVGLLPGDAVFEDDHTVRIDGADDVIGAGCSSSRAACRGR